MGVPFLLFGLACLVAVIDAYDLSYSYKSLKKLLEILIFFWVVNCIKENRLRNSLVLVMIIAATIAGLFGFFQAWRDGVSVANRVEGTMSVYMTFAGILMMIGHIVMAGPDFFDPTNEIGHILFYFGFTSTIKKVARRLLAMCG